MPETPVDSLFAAIDRHFLAPEALARVRLFSRYARQVEGWFKGELLHIFSNLEGAGEIEDWASEVRIAPESRQRSDFRVRRADGLLWIEVKTLFHGIQAGQPVDLGIYFLKSADGVGITEDLVKLMRVPDGDTAVLLFAYPRPDATAWSELMSAYARRIAPIAFKEETSLSDYPPELYVCKLKLTGGF